MQAEEIGEACSQLAVKPPASYGQRPPPQLYRAVVQTAQQPELAIPETPSLKVGGERSCARLPLVLQQAGSAQPAPDRFPASPVHHTAAIVPMQAARQYRRMVRKGLLYTGAGTAVVLAGYWGWRYLKGHQDQASGGGGSGGASSGSSGGHIGAAAGGTP